MTERPPVYEIRPIKFDADSAERLAQALFVAVHSIVDEGHNAINAVADVWSSAAEMDREGLRTVCRGLARYAAEQHRFCNALQNLMLFTDLPQWDDVDDEKETNET